jgi:hypothetical protein
MVALVHPFFEQNTRELPTVFLLSIKGFMNKKKKKNKKRMA